ncbi:hypothetical protein Adu01nite_06660 [Paractinoplanes durhamensis]|uniref:Uncharacterized protein n=2 Tax=Paractinoplanes durhamensis TaxID=113563 RepID=A0ABQ3YP50_9ACTN|nr:hypothetical protein Adu01nite_06660 [Actinoplanes durhamensis]
MSCRTGSADRATVEQALAAMGWCPDHPDDSPYLRGRRAEIVAKLPETVRADLMMRDPVLITTFPNVWGLASFDRRGALLLCLFGDDLAALKDQCVHAVAAFPPTFEQVVADQRCEFDPHVEVRRFDGNALVARGAISSTRHIRFRRYVWSVRRRERVVLLALIGLCVLSTAAAFLLYLFFDGSDWAYVRGYLDRLSSAVQTATVIMAVNLIFEYRDWKGAKTIIEWST